MAQVIFGLNSNSTTVIRSGHNKKPRPNPHPIFIFRGGIKFGSMVLTGFDSDKMFHIRFGSYAYPNIIRPISKPTSEHSDPPGQDWG